MGQESGNKGYGKGNAMKPCLRPPPPHIIICPSTKTIRLRGRLIFNEALLAITRRKLGRIV